MEEDMFRLLTFCNPLPQIFTYGLLAQGRI